MDSHNMNFPNVGMRSLSAVVHFVGTAILATCLARRVAFEDLNTLRGWKRLSTARFTLILTFAISLLFIMATGVLVHGVGLEDSAASCSLAIFSCILLYTTTKLLIYIFLSERVWLVWSNMAASKAGLASLQSPNTPRRTSMHVQSPTTTSPGVEKTQFTPEWQSGIMKRLKNPVYLVCLVSLIGYLVIIILLCINRINGFRKQDGTCVIGLARQGSIPLITYDAYITVLLTTLFVWPLRSKENLSNKLRRLTTRTLLASFAALATSAVNISILAALKGHELGWVCLASCGTDVILNALVLDYVTETRLKSIVKSRSDRARAGVLGLSDSSFPTSPGSPYARPYLNAPPRGMRASQMNPHLNLAHNGTKHSVDFRSQSVLDVKPPGLDVTPTPTTPSFASQTDVSYPPSPFPREDDLDSPRKEYEANAYSDADIDLEHDGAQYLPRRSPSSRSTPLSPVPPRRMISAQQHLPSVHEVLDDSPPQSPRSPSSKTQRRIPASRPALLRGQTSRSSLNHEDIALQEINSASTSPVWDPTTSFAPQQPSPNSGSGTTPPSPSAMSQLSSGDAPERSAKRSSIPISTSVTVSGRGTKSGGSSQTRSRGGSISLPRQMEVVVTSETVVDSD